MKQTLLLLVASFSLASISQAQKKPSALTGYAITAVEKGGKSWKEVRQVNIETGEAMKTIYSNADGMEALNARTGKPVQVKKAATAEKKITVKKVVNLDDELASEHRKSIPAYATGATFTDPKTGATTTTYLTVYTGAIPESPEKPFATNSAAMAYDAKHERLYYTPIGINQLRYIDLKAKTPKVYYFEDEAFGVVKGLHDLSSQITRMVIASDGNGYALSNDGKHLLRFTTGKKPVITDLAAISDDGSNPNVSVNSRINYGGDMIADASGNLYLVTANRNVFRISIETKLASYLGPIQGLPRGFSTNGAMVEEGSKVIVASSESTNGYYRFDLKTLQAEKVSSANAVFNASDLANGNLAFKKEKEETVTTTAPVEETLLTKQPVQEELAGKKGIAVFPNPVVNGTAKLSFTDQPAGRYQVQLLDLNGKTVMAKEVNVVNKSQIVDLSLPDVAKGSYLVRVTNEASDIYTVTKIVVQ